MSYWIRETNGLQCYAPAASSTGFNVEESLSIVEDFCRDIPQQHIGSTDDYSTLAKTGLGDSSMKLSISYISTVICDERLVTELVIDQETCEQAFYKLLDSCGPVSNDNLGFYGGNVPHNCAMFSISAEVDEIVRCGGNPASSFADMDFEVINSAIDEYCSQSFELSPSPQGMTSFTLITPQGQSYNNHLSDGVLFRTRAQFSEQAQHDCEEARAFDTIGDECRRKLRAVRDKCGGEGGGLSETGVNGCVVWTMWAKSFGEDWHAGTGACRVFRLDSSKLRLVLIVKTCRNFSSRSCSKSKLSKSVSLQTLKSTKLIVEISEFGTYAL